MSNVRRPRSTLLDRLTLTTHDIARLCDVAPRTVVAWINRYGLKAHYYPGQRIRRIARADLDAFLLQHGCPAVGRPSQDTPGAQDRPAPLPQQEQSPNQE